MVLSGIWKFEGTRQAWNLKKASLFLRTIHSFLLGTSLKNAQSNHRSVVLRGPQSMQWCSRYLQAENNKSILLHSTDVIQVNWTSLPWIMIPNKWHAERKVTSSKNPTRKKTHLAVIQSNGRCVRVVETRKTPSTVDFMNKTTTTTTFLSFDTTKHNSR